MILPIFDSLNQFASISINYSRCIESIDQSLHQFLAIKEMPSMMSPILPIEFNGENTSTSQSVRAPTGMVTIT